MQSPCQEKIMPEALGHNCATAKRQSGAKMYQFSREQNGKLNKINGLAFGMCLAIGSGSAAHWAPPEKLTEGDSMTMQNTNAGKPAANTTGKKDWASMTKEERHLFSLAKKSEAIHKVQEGDFPSAVRIKLGEHTLFAKPSGVSEKGSVSYSVNPTILTIGNKQVRINKMNVSVLANSMEGLEELELNDATIL